MKHSIFAALLLGGCSATPPAAAPPEAASSTPADAGLPSVRESKEPDAAEPAAAAASAPRPERPARDSPPPGVSPLTADEKDYVKSSCEGLLKAVERAAQKKRAGSKSAVELALEVLRKPPKTPKVDVEKCAALLIRDLETYRAKTVEIEALQTMKRIGVGLASALSREPPSACPSATPTPPDLKALSRGPVDTKAADWSQDGWRCAGFAAAGPIRFQYELRLDKNLKQFEIIARGFPASTEQPTELVFRVPFGGGEADLSQPIYRR